MSDNGKLWDHWTAKKKHWRKSNVVSDDLSLGKLENLKLNASQGVYISIPRWEFDWLVEQAKQNIQKGMEDSKFVRSYMGRINPGDVIQINPPDGMKILMQGRGALYWEGIETNAKHKNSKI